MEWWKYMLIGIGITLLIALGGWECIAGWDEDIAIFNAIRAFYA